MKKNISLIVVVIFLQFFAYNASSQDYEYFVDFKEIGPFNASQRSTALHINVANPEKWYLGTEGGGLWISNDQGGKWRPAMPNHLNIGKVVDIEQDKNNPNNIYYLSVSQFHSADQNNAGVFRSIDGGTTFQKWATPQQISGDSGILRGYDLAVIHSKVFVQTRAGIYQLDDDGIATRIYKATDRCFRMEVLERNADEEVILVVDGNKVYRGSNATGSFVFDSNPVLETRIVHPPFFPSSLICIGYSENHPNVVYAVLSDGRLAQKVHRSDDYGENWTLVYNENIEKQFKKYGGLSWLHGEFNDLWVHEDHPDTLILTSTNMLLSLDGGETWYTKKFSVYDVAYGDMWPQSFATNPSNNQMVVGHDHGLFEGSFGELFSLPGETVSIVKENIVDKSKGVPAFTAYVGDYFPEGDNVVIGGQDRGAWLIYNGMESYLAGGDVYGLVQIGDSNIMVFDKHGGGIQGFNAENGGTHSFLIRSNRGQMEDNNPDVYGTGNQVDSGPNGQVFYANDFSLSGRYIIWKIQSHGGKTAIYQSNEAILSLSVHTISGNVYFLERSATSHIVKKININTNEVTGLLSIPFELNIEEIEVNQSDETILYGWNGFYNGNLFEINTTSGQIENLTQKVSTPWNEALLSIMSMSAVTSNFLLLGTNLGFYYSFDRGQTWVHEPNIPSTSIFDIDFRREDKRVFLFTYGRGAWAATLNGEISDYTPTSANQKRLDFNVYPNPTAEFLKIKLKVTPGHSDTFVRIFSADGKIWLEEEYLNGILETRTQQITISAFSEGTYYIQIQNGSHSLTKPFVVKK